MAKAKGRATDELLTLYALEGFLDRLSTQGRATDPILKGGVLLAAYAVDGVRLSLLDEALAGYAGIAQAKWRLWVRKQQLTDRLPEDFAIVLQDVINFAGPAVSGAARRQMWVHAQRVSTVTKGSMNSHNRSAGPPRSA